MKELNNEDQKIYKSSAVDDEKVDRGRVCCSLIYRAISGSGEVCISSPEGPACLLDDALFYHSVLIPTHHHHFIYFLFVLLDDT